MRGGKFQEVQYDPLQLSTKECLSRFDGRILLFPASAEDLLNKEIS